MAGRRPQRTFFRAMDATRFAISRRVVAVARSEDSYPDGSGGLPWSRRRLVRPVFTSSFDLFPVLASRTARKTFAASYRNNSKGAIMSVAIITGSSGLVGSEAVHHFASLGLEVVGID